tara:strand:- start:324 stop:791 length:468 start_codon:yes stop_codon:yes gene_type:complete
MSWFNIIKLDKEERIRGILSNWIDSLIDWTEDVLGELATDKKTMLDNHKELQNKIEDMPDYLKEFLTSMLRNTAEAESAIDGTSEMLTKVQTSVREAQELINDEKIPVILILNSLKENNMTTIPELTDITQYRPPTAPNIDRLIGQLELGEGYEE